MRKAFREDARAMGPTFDGTCEGGASPIGTNRMRSPDQPGPSNSLRCRVTVAHRLTEGRMFATRLGVAVVVIGVGACSAEQLGGARRDAGGMPPVDGTGLRVDVSTGPVFPPDASTGTVHGDACAASSLPPPTRPIIPQASVADACSADSDTAPGRPMRLTPGSRSASSTTASMALLTGRLR